MRLRRNWANATTLMSFRTHVIIPMGATDVNKIQYEMGTAHAVASTTRPYGFLPAMRTHWCEFQQSL
jgi:hypothetical protein